MKLASQDSWELSAPKADRILDAWCPAPGRQPGG